MACYYLSLKNLGRIIYIYSWSIVDHFKIFTYNIHWIRWFVPSMYLFLGYSLRNLFYRRFFMIWFWFKRVVARYVTLVFLRIVTCRGCYFFVYSFNFFIIFVQFVSFVVCATNQFSFKWIFAIFVGSFYYNFIRINKLNGVSEFWVRSYTNVFLFGVDVSSYNKFDT